MRIKALYGAVVGSILGIILSLLATNNYIRVHSQGFAEKSICNINEFINCDIVAASSYASMFEAPVSWWGFLFYIFCFGLAIYALLTRKKQAAAFGWGLSFLAVLYSVRMAYILLGVLDILCLECVGMYLANFILFVSFFVSLNVPWLKLFSFAFNYLKSIFCLKTSLDFQTRFWGYALSCAAMFALGFVVIGQVQAKGKSGVAKASIAEKLIAFEKSAQYPIEINPKWPLWGSEDAKVVIVEFSDFQCPFCKLASINIKPYLHEFRDQVQFRYVNLPIDSSCNKAMQFGGHAQACDAAKAALCAQKFGDFWTYHDQIFEYQRQLRPEIYPKLAEKMGWNTEDFEACIYSPETEARLQEDLAEAARLYVSGTPAVFLNGRKLKYWRDGKFVQAVIKAELAKK